MALFDKELSLRAQKYATRWYGIEVYMDDRAYTSRVVNLNLHILDCVGVNAAYRKIYFPLILAPGWPALSPVRFPNTGDPFPIHTQKKRRRPRCEFQKIFSIIIILRRWSLNIPQGTRPPLWDQRYSLRKPGHPLPDEGTANTCRVTWCCSHLGDEGVDATGVIHPVINSSLN